VIVDDTESPVTRGLPKTFAAPVNEWYSWRPSPRLDKDIHVLVTLDPAQYPLGIKSMITDKDPDVPVVWTNTRCKMLYMNMGHGDRIFTNSIQNMLIENGLLWLLGTGGNR
jgi:type 1 glutamine amidotransferase